MGESGSAAGITSKRGRLHVLPELKTGWAREVHCRSVDSVKGTEATANRAETQSRCPGALGPEICSLVCRYRRVARTTTKPHGKCETLQERVSCTRCEVCKSCRASKAETIGRGVGLWPGASVQAWENSSDEDNGGISGNYSPSWGRDWSRCGSERQTRRSTREIRNPNIGLPRRTVFVRCRRHGPWTRARYGTRKRPGHGIRTWARYGGRKWPGHGIRSRPRHGDGAQGRRLGWT